MKLKTDMRLLSFSLYRISNVVPSIQFVNVLEKKKRKKKGVLC